MNRIFLFLSMLLLLSVSKVSSCFAGDNDPIGSWHAPRHCYANDEVYREARRQRREAEDRWIQRNREREREQNRRNRRTKKLLEVPKTHDSLEEYRQYRRDRERSREERNRKRENWNSNKRKKACHDMDVVSPIRNRGIYLNQLGDMIIDGKLLKDITEMGKGNVICTVCHKKVKFEDIFSHYKEKNHRFFRQTNPNRHR